MGVEHFLLYNKLPPDANPAHDSLSWGLQGSLSCVII